ncbi:hypothetical protein SAMN04489712_112139 [Thermomonospora echinospora]|uniref:Uncharacterized protein n=1 Tax=Thermomonospora echinospora TaxID=1992 RepID=A0A1H6D1K2_9ACTN|nr:hypothetical protein [Thermomonospora echinospora]SEG78898.1 hypothetical protein SAMN04489712_112139 [Thermomonospora echinospora]
MALRPVAHTRGELAAFLGCDHEAAAHFTRVATIADRGNAPRWAAEARSRTAAWPSVSSVQQTVERAAASAMAVPPGSADTVPPGSADPGERRR